MCEPVQPHPQRQEDCSITEHSVFVFEFNLSLRPHVDYFCGRGGAATSSTAVTTKQSSSYITVSNDSATMNQIRASISIASTATSRAEWLCEGPYCQEACARSYLQPKVSRPINPSRFEARTSEEVWKAPNTGTERHIFLDREICRFRETERYLKSQCML